MDAILTPNHDAIGLFYHKRSNAGMKLRKDLPKTLLHAIALWIVPDSL
jgi:hypothetical protein